MMQEPTVENARDEGAPEQTQASPAASGGYSRSQAEVNGPYKKRPESEQAQWEQDPLPDDTAGETADAGGTRYADMLEDLSQQAEALKEAYPEFDFSRELEERPMFAYMLAEGAPLQSVYEYFYPEKARARLRGSLQDEVMENIRARNARPQGLKHVNGAGSVRDVSLLSDEEILRIDARVKKGERVLL